MCASYSRGVARKCTAVAHHAGAQAYRMARLRGILHGCVPCPPRAQERGAATGRLWCTQNAEAPNALHTRGVVGLSRPPPHAVRRGAPPCATGRLTALPRGLPSPDPPHPSQAARSARTESAPRLQHCDGDGSPGSAPPLSQVRWGERGGEAVVWRRGGIARHYIGECRLGNANQHFPLFHITATRRFLRLRCGEKKYV